MATEVGLSPQHFARCSRPASAPRPTPSSKTQRIDAAVAALRREHAMPIAAIAAACGFSSQSHMTELMRRRVGLTPSQVRRGLKSASQSGGTHIHPFEE